MAKKYKLSIDRQQKPYLNQFQLDDCKALIKGFEDGDMGETDFSYEISAMKQAADVWNDDEIIDVKVSVEWRERTEYNFFGDTGHAEIRLEMRAFREMRRFVKVTALLSEMWTAQHMADACRVDVYSLDK